MMAKKKKKKEAKFVAMQEQADGTTIDHFHVVPEDDIAQHKPSIDCFCQPTMNKRDLDTGAEMWIHRRMKDNPN